MADHRWKVGDRCIWPNPQRDRTRCGAPYVTVLSPGTVIAVDLPGVPPGVQVVLDVPVNGPDPIYATHGGLERPTTDETGDDR